MTKSYLSNIPKVFKHLCNSKQSLLKARSMTVRKTEEERQLYLNIDRSITQVNKTLGIIEMIATVRDEKQ